MTGFFALAGVILASLHYLPYCDMIRASRLKGGGDVRLYEYIADLYKAAKVAKVLLAVYKNLRDLFF